MTDHPESFSLADLEGMTRIERLIDLRDELWAVRAPPAPHRLIPNKVEEMQAQAWRAVIDAARDLVEWADGACLGGDPPLDRVVH
ncbi:hypothetical protein E2C06_30520 [Dankookia rubra]|uniref:Uncharacterized protein n=1 Tax=Dankookia rubra TaxID=1442381 RepID=A0A4V3A9D6_9PROT|nr:hypothetical protein [Dankookia rubra]TDH58805.1 hypothetical protein E2C06_30520 [Dankookia rubra]